MTSAVSPVPREPKQLRTKGKEKEGRERRAKEKEVMHRHE